MLAMNQNKYNLFSDKACTDLRAYEDLVEWIDLRGVATASRLTSEHRRNLGQFFTPKPVARRLAQLISTQKQCIRILDAGAGLGILAAAAVLHLCERVVLPTYISVTAYEVDEHLLPYLEETLNACNLLCQHIDCHFEYNVICGDFIEESVQQLNNPLMNFYQSYDCAILNPPYKKISNNSSERTMLQSINIDTNNMYSAFLALASKLLTPMGELVSITPRSFCNGVYFKKFRHDFLSNMKVTDLQVFSARNNTFDDVLQETIIMRAVKTKVVPRVVRVTELDGLHDAIPVVNTVTYNEVVAPNDPEHFIRIIPDGISQHISRIMGQFSYTLQDLGLTVSTGKVVDFRVKEALRSSLEQESYPLIYPHNCINGKIVWPIHKGTKPQVLKHTHATQKQILPSETFVLIKRFSAKEESRRVNAAIYHPENFPTDFVAFENHLNYFHCQGSGLPRNLAKGLALFLNSSLLDIYFRQFNGHTQVNARDLRNLRYPSKNTLEQMGSQISDNILSQDEIDNFISTRFLKGRMDVDFMDIKQKINDAKTILNALELPSAQCNERSALTLLALLNLKPQQPWNQASAPLVGITPIMNFIATHYHKQYKPNTRETVRRQSMHQFVDAHIVRENPDEPSRPTNSPKFVYKIEETALELIQCYGSELWQHRLSSYLKGRLTLKKRYAQQRKQSRIPLLLNESIAVSLSSGGQNVLVEKIIKEFAPCFAPQGEVIYLGDTEKKFLHCDVAKLGALGITIEKHGKMPDVVIHYTEKNWLLIIEAVTSHGPINPKRMQELEAIFTNSTAGLVYITAFLTRQDMRKYITEIAWETEVWVADSPGHMIHFNGSRFLGPHPNTNA